MADLKRWSTLVDNPDWNARAELIIGYISSSSNVVDIGCGTQYLRKYISSDRYLGVDIVERPDCMLIAHLNTSGITINIAPPPSLFEFLEVLECINLLLRLTQGINAWANQLIFDYTLIDSVTDIEERLSIDWV